MRGAVDLPVKRTHVSRWRRALLSNGREDLVQRFPQRYGSAVNGSRLGGTRADSRAGQLLTVIDYARVSGPHKQRVEVADVVDRLRCETSNHGVCEVEDTRSSDEAQRPWSSVERSRIGHDTTCYLTCEKPTAG
jgi:hypothetical protein